MTQAQFWTVIAVIVLGMGLSYWDLRDRLGRIESDIKHFYHERDKDRPTSSEPVSGLSGSHLQLTDLSST